MGLEEGTRSLRNADSCKFRRVMQNQRRDVRGPNAMNQSRATIISWFLTVGFPLKQPKTRTPPSAAVFFLDLQVLVSWILGRRSASPLCPGGRASKRQEREPTASSGRTLWEFEGKAGFVFRTDGLHLKVF